MPILKKNTLMIFFNNFSLELSRKNNLSVKILFREHDNMKITKLINRSLNSLATYYLLQYYILELTINNYYSRFGKILRFFGMLFIYQVCSKQFFSLIEIGVKSIFNVCRDGGHTYDMFRFYTEKTLFSTYDDNS